MSYTWYLVEVEEFIKGQASTSALCLLFCCNSEQLNTLNEASKLYRCLCQALSAEVDHEEDSESFVKSAVFILESAISKLEVNVPANTDVNEGINSEDSAFKAESSIKEKPPFYHHFEKIRSERRWKRLGKRTRQPREISITRPRQCKLLQISCTYIRCGVDCSYLRINQEIVTVQLSCGWWLAKKR